MKRLLLPAKLHTYSVWFYALIIIAIFLPTDLPSQTFYRNYGQTTVNEGGQAIVALPDGNLAVGGYKGDSALVMKVSQTGDVLWSRIFKPQNGFENVIHSLAVTPDNYIIGTGNINNGSTFYNFYFKIGLNGTIEWIKKFDQSQSMYFRRMWFKNPSEYILHGSVYDINGVPYPDIMWKSVDPASGSILASSQRINIIPSPAYIDDIYSSVLGRGEGSYVLGRTYVAGNAATGMRAFITKFNGQGNHIWSKYLMQTDADQARIYGIDIIYDQDSLVSGYTGDVNGASTNFTVGLFKTDTMGNVAWAKNYDIIGSSAEYCFKVLKTASGYSMVGYKSGANSDFYIFSVDRNGNLLWARSYGTTANEGIKVASTNNAVVINGDIYFTGYSTTGTNSDLVIARVENNGDLDCLTPANISITVSNNPTNSIVCNVTTMANTVNLSNYTGVSSGIASGNCSQPYLGNDTMICGPHTLNATTAGATQYTWSDGSTLPVLTVTQPGTYWVQVQAGCCLASDTIVVSSSSAPAALSVTASGCPLSYIFSVSTSTTIGSYQWNFGDGNSSTTAVPSHTYSAPGTYSVTLTYTTTCGNIILDTIINIQSQIIVPAFNHTITPCVDNTVSFDNTSVVPLFEWQFGDGTTSTIDDPTHTYLLPGAYMVLLITNPGAACADTASTIVTVSNDHPLAQFSSVSLSCSYDVSFSNSSQHATNYEWNLGDGNTSSAQDPVHSYSGPGTYSVTLISINGGCSDTTFQLITVNGLPVVSVNSPIICNGQSAALTAIGAVNYSWSTGSTGSTISVNPSTTTSYTVTGTDINSCTASAVATVTVSSSGALVDLGADTALCNQQAGILLDAGNISLATYTWNTGDTTQTILVTEPSAYWVTVSTGTCSDQDTINISLFAGIELGTDIRLCTQEEMKLVPKLARNVPTTYLWSTGATSSFITVTGPDTYIVQATQGPCLFIDSVKVTGSVSEGALYVPNTFTPGPDYLNDVFYAEGEAVLELNMKIFNRWGEMIFESHQQSEGWDGTFKGHPVQADTYVWIIDYVTDCSEMTILRKTGTITIVR